VLLFKGPIGWGSFVCSVAIEELHVLLFGRLLHGGANQGDLQSVAFEASRPLRSLFAHSYASHSALTVMPKALSLVNRPRPHRHI
jgi:hypothetical protein